MQLKEKMRAVKRPVSKMTGCLTALSIVRCGPSASILIPYQDGNHANLKSLETVLIQTQAVNASIEKYLYCVNLRDAKGYRNGKSPDLKSHGGVKQGNWFDGGLHKTPK